jgi:hypothetical protein
VRGVLSIKTKTIVLFDKTAVRLRSQRPFIANVQGDTGHPVNKVVDSRKEYLEKGGPMRWKGTRGS